jgi:hypothetical protein
LLPASKPGGRPAGKLQLTIHELTPEPW